MAKVTISLPDELLYALDRSAQLRRRSRSELLREALETHLREDVELRRWEDPRVLRAIETQDRIARQCQDTDWDPVAEIRRFRDGGR